MDLTSLKPSVDSVEIILKHPITMEPLFNDDGEEMSVTVLSPFSKEYKGVVATQTNKRLSAAQKSKKVVYMAEDLEEAAMDLLIGITVDWNIVYDGDKPKFTAEKAREIYNDLPWVKDQIEEVVSDTEGFIKG